MLSVSRAVETVRFALAPREPGKEIIFTVNIHINIIILFLSLMLVLYTLDSTLGTPKLLGKVL